MSKHQAILDYLEKLPIGKRVSVRSISNYLQVSDGTAYRAIKEAENRGIVETRPRSGTVRVKSKKAVLEHLTFREIVEITGSEVLAGKEGLEREFNKFYIGAMTEEHILDSATRQCCSCNGWLRRRSFCFGTGSQWSNSYLTYQP